MRRLLVNSKHHQKRGIGWRPALAFLASITCFITLSFAATSDSANLSITVNEVLTISSDGGSLNVASLLPDTPDTSQTSTLTLSSNATDGFTVTVDLDDLGSTPGRLCADSTPANGVCDVSGHVFNGDGDPLSHISFTSNAGTGGLTGTFTTVATNLGTAGSYQAYTGTELVGNETFDVDYEIYAQDIFTDAPIYADTYKGTITFTIVAN